ncbi:hypothetical protein [Stenotrophomonas phage CM2]
MGWTNWRSMRFDRVGTSALALLTCCWCGKVRRSALCHSTEEVNAWLDEHVMPLVGQK